MNLEGSGLRAESLDIIRGATRTIFSEDFVCKMKESYVIYEKGMLPEDVLLRLCQREYSDVELVTPMYTYIPKDILAKFSTQEAVPIKYDLQGNTIIVGTIPENKDQQFFCGNMNIKVVYVPLYYYIKLKLSHEGKIKYLYRYPITQLFDMIVAEAVQLGASDITISTHALGSRIYYNCRKRKVFSKQTLSAMEIDELAKHIATKGGQTIGDVISRKPRYISIDLDIHNRGRVVINKTFYGYSITIRILPNELLDKSLEDLNLTDNTCKFIRDVVLSKEKGLRIFIGETMSGKNTTILSSLLELVRLGTMKIVSVEQPVEILVDGIEQIDAETDEEFELNADSLLRQNPDIVYFTEITQRTAESILKQSNTSKAVFSTIHANSISDVLSRLQDITRLDTDRLIQTLQSCVYQILVRDEETDTIHPENVCVHFDEDLKMELYGKSMPEIIKRLRKEEGKWVS